MVKVFLTKVEITTPIHQTTHKLKYKTFTSHETKAPQIVPKRFAVISTAESDDIANEKFCALILSR